jgi:hypothetical protein
VLSKNLEGVERVFPFIISIGKTLEDHASQSKNVLRQVYLDALGNLALLATKRYFEQYLKDKFKLGKLSHMSPGQLKDWPLTQQRMLFSLFNDADTTVGVTLTEKCLMIPTKSISGIIFPKEVSFESCQLCPRENCPARRASYDPSLKEQYDLE